MRIFNRFLALIVGLALMAVGVIIMIEVIALAVNAAPVVLNWHAMLRWGQRNTWNAASVKITAGIIGLVGLIILLAQLKRRRPTRLAIHPDGLNATTQVALTRKGLRAAVNASLREVDGVQHSKIKLKRRRVAVRVSPTSSDAAASVAAAVRSAVTGRLDELALARSFRTSVRTASKGRNST